VKDMNIKRGDIFWATVKSEDGREERRPVVIISNDVTGSRLSVCRVRSGFHDLKLKSNIFLNKDLYGLPKESFIDTSEVIAIAKKDLIQKIAHLTDNDLNLLERNILKSIGISYNFESEKGVFQNNLEHHESQRAFKVYKDLNIKGTTDQISILKNKIIEQIEQSDEWDVDCDNNFNNFLVILKNQTTSPSGTIFISVDDRELKLTNIIPIDKSRLTYDEYNSIVDEFYNNYIKNIIEKTGLSVQIYISPSQLSIEDIVESTVVSKLKIFSMAANKSTGSAHPLDKRRWFDFIIESFRRDEIIPNDYLYRWLVEIEGWEDEKATDLVIDYENSIELLKYYKENDVHE
jgi:mRNA-degrading endonuclease toxin of MazEF toxin-antitoxin module